MSWTKFFDMSSGGYEKTEYTTIFIELPEEEAIDYFEKRFNIDPNDITCSCCGNDYSIYEVDFPENIGERDLVIKESEL